MISTSTPSAEGAIILPCASAPLVSILIPTTSQADLLARCLRSLAQHLGADMACEVIVVLNAVTDDVKAVARNAQGILIAESPVNLGTAGGYNRGRSLARGRYLVLLHDDTEIQPNWLEALVETAEARPEAGAVAGMVFHPDGKLQLAGAILWRNALTSLPWGAATANPDDFKEVRPVDYSGTCSLLVRSDTWDAIQGLNEDIYPAYFVDVDLSMSIRKHGQIVLFTPHSRAFHHKSASSHPLLRQFAVARNRVTFMAKWGEELQSYEDYAPDDPAALKRAQARTEQTARRLQAAWTPHPAPESETFSASFDTASHDLSLLRKERSWNRDYTSWLESRCGELDELRVQYQQAVSDLHLSQSTHELTKQKLALNKAEAVELKAKCIALREQLQILKKSRWWHWWRK